jgi:hypothetical protein
MPIRSSQGRPAGWALGALLSLAAGYTLLWRGGTTLAAALLVAGYVVAIPMTLLALAREGDTGDTGNSGDTVAGRPPYAIGALVGVALLALYVATLAPTTAMWDASEYIAAAKVLGIPHPPGNPVFVLIAHTFGALPLPVGYAARINLLAALTSAASAMFWFLVAHRSVQRWTLPEWGRRLIAGIAALLGATAFTVWNQSVVNEKVYTLAMLGLAVTSWLAMRWLDAPAESRRADALLVLMAYLAGLGYANHPAGMLPVPAVGCLVLFTRPATLLRWRTLLMALVAVAVGLSAFAFQPVRAAHHPAINVGAPTACTEGPRLDCTFSAETWRLLMANVERQQYGGHSWIDRKAPIDAQVGTWWLYFRWQWWRDSAARAGPFQSLVAWLFLGLALCGGVLHWRRDRASFAYLAPLLATLTPLLIVYLNFKYGASFALELGDSVDREVRDRDYFYLWSFSTLALWIAMGLGGAWQWVAHRLGREAAPRWAAAWPVLLLALVPLLGNWREAPRRGQSFTAAWARDLLHSVEPYAVLITNGDNDSFPVWYAQLVEGVRPDVTLAIVPYLNMPWFADHLLREPVPKYAGDGIAAYRALDAGAPTVPILNIAASAVNEIPEVAQLDEAMRFVHAGIDATVPAGVYTRDQLIALRIIQSVVPSRPVYFSIGPYAQQLGLGDYVVMQGLAQRLVTVPARTLPGVVQTPGGWMDVSRTAALWSTYGAPQALLRQGRWVDRPSASIPAAYIVTAQWLSGGLDQQGDSAVARTVMTTAEQMAGVMGFLR